MECLRFVSLLKGLPSLLVSKPTSPPSNCKATVTGRLLSPSCTKTHKRQTHSLHHRYTQNATRRTTSSSSRSSTTSGNASVFGKRHLQGGCCLCERRFFFFHTPRPSSLAPAPGRQRQERWHGKTGRLQVSHCHAAVVAALHGKGVGDGLQSSQPARRAKAE